jgi:hypothetical protein
VLRTQGQFLNNWNFFFLFSWYEAEMLLYILYTARQWQRHTTHNLLLTWNKDTYLPRKMK